MLRILFYIWLSWFIFSRLSRAVSSSSSQTTPPPRPPRPPNPMGRDPQTAGDTLPNGFADLVAMLAKQAKCDGAVTQSEIGSIDTFFTHTLNLSAAARAEAIQIFQRAKDSHISFEFHARRYHALYAMNRPMLAAVLQLLVILSLADGEMSAEEEMLINQAQAIFGVQSEEYAQYRARQRQRTRTAGEKGEKYYAKVLGLRGEMTRDEVKKAYRKLVREYHPDRVAHLGESVRKTAEEEMKKINEAYDFFQRKYAL